jgi:glc operon protein GlcG
MPARAQAQADKEPAKAPRLIYFSKEEVDANFVHPKGMDDTLFHSDFGSESFIVKTSGRTKTLAAETHKTYTDILYIVKGSATLITGGTLVDDITPATYPDGKPFTETTMARSIVGGQSRRLAVGDVVVIPNGLPHWFTDVEGPFWFFNVKSR